MNTPDSIDAIVTTAIERACNLPAGSVTPSQSIALLGLDSMNMTSVISEIEALYDLEMTSDQIIDILQLPAVADVIAYVSKIPQAVAV